MTTRIKLRRDTAANWTASNPILAAGEPGLETDTGKTKYGDGATTWISLGYATGGITAREQIGYFNLHGTVPSLNSVDLWFEGVENDPAGNAYYVGGQYDWTGDDIQWPHVVKVNSLGEVQWQKELTWADGYEGNGVSAVYNTATDQLVVVAEMWKMDNPDKGAAVITMNAETGAMVGDPKMIRDEVTSDGSDMGNVQPSDITLDSNGDPIVVGHKHGNVSTYALTTSSVGTTDVIFVDSAIFTDKTPFPYNEWYITGTNIGSQVQITDVNYYYNQPAVGMVSTGTGSTFAIDNVGDGTYAVLSFGGGGGSGYVVGNKINILGTDLGGATPANDATITVTSVNAGAITAVNINGTAAGSTNVSYPNVSGTNIVSGSNFNVSVAWKLTPDLQPYFPDYPDRFGASIAQYGSGFALGDTLYLNPNQYGGSTSATITVTQVGGGGEIYDFAFTGTFNTSTIKLMTNNSVNFSTTGSWIANNYSAEAFIWTQDWAKTFGESDFDKVNAVATDSAGNIYLGCITYDEGIPAPWGYGVYVPLLVKLDSAGNQQWAKKFTPGDVLFYNNDGYSGVAVDSNDDIVVVESTLVTKIDSDGTVLWQKAIAQDYPLDMWNVCVDLDSDDNIYVAGEYSYMGTPTNDNFLIVKFDTDGNVLWQRETGTSDEESSSWDNGFQILSVANGQVHIAGSTYNNSNNDVALAISFPTDGSGADVNHKGKFFLHATDWSISTSTATVYNFTVAVTSTQVTLTTETNFTCITTSTDNSSQALRTGSVDGRIEDLYSLSFEDGSVQTTAYNGGLTREENRVYNTNDFYPNITHAGKLMRWDADSWNDSVEIYIPHNDDVPFPVGTQMHFVKERGINSFMFWCWADIGNDSDMRIMPSSPADGMLQYAFNTSEGWSVRHPDYDWSPAKVTITKTDTNTWLLECSSSNHIMDWNW